MSLPLETLLQPVATAQPCGPDLSYDPRFDELETLLKGKPEVEIGSVVKPAEPPDWRAVRDKAIAILSATKHLRPAVILTCAALRADGLTGFCDGLRLVHGLIENFWNDLHPRLDPDDDNDPQQRLNILSGLTSPRNPGGDVAGWLQIVDYLNHAPLCQPRGVPPISLDTIATAQSSVSSAGEEGAAVTGPDLATIETQIRSASPDQLVANHAAVGEAIKATAAIDAFLSATLGAGGAISFEELTQTLTQIERTLAAYLPGSASTVGSELPAASEDSGGDAPIAPAPISGSIRSRDDVVRMLDKICDYYRQVEPGSPVPYLVRRAQKLAVMNFVDAVQELSIATPDQLKPSMGSAVEVPSGE